MQHLECGKQDGILVVRMGRGKANALNRALVEDLNLAVDEAIRDESVRGMVLSSAVPRFFSSGFDVREAFSYDRETMVLFFARFVDLYDSLFRIPKPTVAAIAGHAYGGGAMLATACDLRIFSRGPFGFALPEVNLGVSLPPCFIRMLTSVVGAGRARELALSGDPVSAERALGIGLACELVEPEEALPRALERCAALARKPAAAFAAMKHTLREAADCGRDACDRGFVEEFIAQWYSPESEESRKKLAGSVGSGGPVPSS
jgi:Delta3-Delta2-enoyl-CoA isomerase